MSNWTPLTDLWDEYQETLDARPTYLDPSAGMEEALPPNLQIGEMEREDIEAYIRERMQELTQAPVSPSIFAAYLFRTLMVGMMWEQERIGN